MAEIDQCEISSSTSTPAASAEASGVFSQSTPNAEVREAHSSTSALTGVEVSGVEPEVGCVNEDEMPLAMPSSEPQWSVKPRVHPNAEVRETHSSSSTSATGVEVSGVEPEVGCVNEEEMPLAMPSSEPQWSVKPCVQPNTEVRESHSSSSTSATGVEVSGVEPEVGCVNEEEMPLAMPSSEPQWSVKPRVHPGRLTRHQLPLHMKIEVIRLHEEKELGIRAITDVMNMHGFKCGKTQVRNILLRKQEWIEQYAQNAPLDRKRKMRKTGYEELNLKVYKWFEETLEKMLPITGHMIQAKALEIGRELGFPNFTASNGWLESFRKRHSISFGKGDGVDRRIAAAKAEELQINAETLEFYLQNRKTKKKSAKQNANTQSSTIFEMSQFQQRYLEEQRMYEMAIWEGLANGRLAPNDERGEHSFSTTVKQEIPSDDEVQVVEEVEEVEKTEILHENVPTNFKSIHEAGAALKDIRQFNASFSPTLKHEMPRDEELRIEGEEEEQEQEQNEKLQENMPTKFKSIHEVGAALKDIRQFFVANGYANLVEGCSDLEELVARECHSMELLIRRSTSVLDHLNPLDTRPGPDMMK